MRIAQLASVGLLALSLFSAAEARGDAALELERAKNSYDAGRYEEGVERFRDLLSNEEVLSNREELRQARAYYAACLIAVGEGELADEQLEMILGGDPTWRPDPVLFPGKLVDRFAAVRLRVEAELEAQASAERQAQEEARRAQAEYLRALRELARGEVIVEQNSRFVAALPFGAGQFQNGQKALGYAFLVGQSLSAGASVASFIALQSKAHEAANAPDSLRANFNDDLRAWRLRTNVSFAVFAGLAAGGILHAQLSFVPEVREVRERKLPKPPPGLPVAGALPGGAYLGWQGRF